MPVEFLVGKEYSRDDIWEAYHPGEGKRPPGGIWVGGYVTDENDLLVFANIGVAGKTGHDFPNHIEEETGNLIWYGKPNTHSGQPLMKKIINGELALRFFARWDNSKPFFTYLGDGNVEKYLDGAEWKPDHHAIKFDISIENLNAFANRHEDNPATTQPVIPSSQNDSEQTIFTMEKYLEEFLVSNWHSTELGKTHNIYSIDGEVVGNQFPADGNQQIDILALSKDEKEFLVIELKRGKADDKVVGQVQRYMGFVMAEVATSEQEVRGCIIALEDSLNIRRALMVNPLIDFYTYEVSFSLNNKNT